MRVLGLLATVLLLTGCSTQGLQILEDDRVEWVTEDRSTVTLPFTLEWETPGYEVTGPTEETSPDAGYFAIFIDRSPQARNAPLASLAAGDEVCANDPECPDDQWYRDRKVLVVEDATSVTIEQLPSTADEGEEEFHDFTLVLLDGQGRRQGESAFRLRLRVDRGGGEA